MARFFRSAAASVASLFRRRQYESDLDEELQFHLEMETEKNVRLGMSPKAARLQAMRTFGGVVQTKDDLRSLRGLDRLDSLWQDLRYGLRSLGKNHGYTAVVVITLALGIGANTAVFSAVYAVLFKPLPYESGPRLVRIERSAPRLGLDGLGMTFSVPEIEDIEAKAQSLEHVVEYHGMPFTLLGNGEPERVQTGVVSSNFFDVFGVTPHLGRGFERSDEAHHAEAVLLLSHDYWQERHGGDPDIVGQVFEMNDRQHRVIGVLPPLPPFPDENDVYMPSTGCPFRSAPAFVTNRTGRMMTVFATLKPGGSLQKAQDELASLARSQAKSFPAIYPASRGHELDAIALDEELTANARPTLVLLLATAGFVLLIACANVANVMLSRLLKRQPELALRAAIGASRGRIASQLLVESTVLTVASGAIGIGIAWLGRDLIVSFASRMTPRASEITVDATVLGFALTLSLLTGLVFGVGPAFLSSLGRAPGIARERHRSPRLRHLLVVTEIALSLVLLTGAGLMLRSVARLEGIDPGYRAEHVLSMLLDLDWARYDGDATRAFHEELLKELSRHPGVVHAGIGRSIPLERSATPSAEIVRVEWMEDAGRDGERAPTPLVDVHAVSESYFDAIGAKILAGRGFTPEDNHETHRVAILNAEAARALCPSRNPIGQRIAGSAGLWHTVVGIVGNVRHYELGETPPPTVYAPLRQAPIRVANLVVRTTDEPSELVADVKHIVHAIDPDQAVAQIQTLEDVRYESIATPKLTTHLLLLFAALAVVVAAFGLGGALMLTVSQRTHELGMRLALGATPGDVRLLVLRSGWRLTFVGLGLGLVVALASTHLLGGLLFEVGPRDPATFSLVTLLLLVIATGASFVAARRAGAIDVLKAIRTE